MQSGQSSVQNNTTWKSPEGKLCDSQFFVAPFLSFLQVFSCCFVSKRNRVNSLS
jgi:hypothetical protein